MTRALFFLLALLSLFAVPALGAEEAALDRRVMNLAHELRCLVCQNQTIADSNAPLAVDLRNEIRVQLKAGRSEQEVTDFMVARYGDFVLYRPPFKASTLLLWIGPFLLLVLGGYLLLRRVRRREPEVQLSASERERAAKLLE